MSIGKRLADIRRKQSLNQVEFAEHFGVSQSAYKNYEREATDPPVVLLAAICTTYKIDIRWLILGEGAPNSDVLKSLVERSVLIVERFVDEAKEEMSSEGKAALVSLVFEYLSSHPETSEVFLASVMQASLRKG